MNDSTPSFFHFPEVGPTGWSEPSADTATLDVEVDSSLDSKDMQYDDNLIKSLTSSIVDYPMEHGRRYHAYRSGQYMRPNDEPEMERLLILHKIMTSLIGGLYMAPMPKDRTRRILDIGTGSGIWAIEIGEEFPHALVIGNDLSADMPVYVPPNVRFEVDDVESPWLHEAKFSWIFCRYMAASISNWPALVANIYENLEPGGWAEFQDFDLQYYSDDGSLGPDSPLFGWISTLLEASRRVQREPNPGSQLEGWARQAGFCHVRHKRFKVPIGPWARDPMLKEIGLYNRLQIMSGLEGLSLRLYTSVLRWKEEEVLAMLSGVRRDLQDPKIHGMLDFHVVYGQKVIE